MSELYDSQLDIIAEIGSTWHHPNERIGFENAKRAIAEASTVGATIVKFQVFRALSLYSKQRAPQLHNSFGQYELPMKWLPKLKREAEKRNVQLWASVFDVDLVSSVAKHVDGLKIASGDITFLPLVRKMTRVAHKNKLTLGVSTGAATPNEIETALRIITSNALSLPRLVLFHCRSAYPADPHTMNLRSIFHQPLIEQVDDIGLSDHTMTSGTAQIALAMGYTVIEKHFGVHNSYITPDHTISLQSGEFANFVSRLHITQEIMGNDNKKEIIDIEEHERLWARRGTDGLRPLDHVKESENE